MERDVTGHLDKIVPSVARAVFQEDDPENVAHLYDVAYLIGKCADPCASLETLVRGRLAATSFVDVFVLAIYSVR